MPHPTLTTPRLRLRPLRDDHADALFAMNADAEVTRYLLTPITRADSDSTIQRAKTLFATHGFGPFAVEHGESADFLGWVGLLVPTWTAHFTPCVEIGWRLARRAWGHGYASEAAHAVCTHGFTAHALAEIVALTVPANTRSQNVMRRLGMTRNPADDFDHPRIPADHPLRRHILYRLRPDQLTSPLH